MHSLLGNRHSQLLLRLCENEVKKFQGCPEEEKWPAALLMLIRFVYLKFFSQFVFNHRLVWDRVVIGFEFNDRYIGNRIDLIEPVRKWELALFIVILVVHSMHGVSWPKSALVGYTSVSVSFLIRETNFDTFLSHRNSTGLRFFWKLFEIVIWKLSRLWSNPVGFAFCKSKVSCNFWNLFFF